MSRSLHRARAVALSIAVALGVASVLTGCSSVEVETGDGGGTVAQAGDGTVPAAIDQTTTTKPGADPEQAGPGDELRQTYIDALLASYPDDGEPPWTDEAITCLAPKWVDAVGVEAFQDAGITPDDVRDDNGSFDDLPITAPVAEEMVDAIVECGVPLAAFAVEALPSTIRDDPDAVACVNESVTDEDIRGVMVAAMTGDRDADPRALIEGCIERFTPELPPPSSTSMPR